jgi:hypothetical protein
MRTSELAAIARSLARLAVLTGLFAVAAGCAVVTQNPEYDSYLSAFNKAKAEGKLEEFDLDRALKGKSIGACQNFLELYPKSVHKDEVTARLKTLEYEQASSPHASFRAKANFVRRYRGSSEAQSIRKDMATMADIEARVQVDPGMPNVIRPCVRWDVTVTFVERNGVGAKITCDSLLARGGKNWQKTFWNPSPLSGSIRIPANGASQYSFSVDGQDLGCCDVSFRVEDDGGHTYLTGVSLH